MPIHLPTSSSSRESRRSCNSPEGARALQAKLRRLGMPLVAVTTLSCSAQTSGPCMIYFDDPVVTFATAVDSATQLAIPEVVMTGISFNGSPVTDLRFLLETGGPVHGASATAEGIRCTIACAFGAAEGTYSMVLKSPSSVDTPIQFFARYATAKRGPGGCPTHLSQGVVVNVQMRSR